MTIKPYRIGMAGLDTSHVPAFANLLHEQANPHHVPGARIVAAFPEDPPDFHQSISRVEGFTTELRDKHSVKIVDSISDLQGKCDAVMLESIDGGVHLEQFREVAEWGVPVFIDKPLTLSSDEAREILRIADEKNVRVTSASGLRFAEPFHQALAVNEEAPVIGGDFYGPMPLLEQCPGYFWYGIHSAEMLFATMGTGCREVLAVREQSHDLVVGRWNDGRVGVLRGNREGNQIFGGIIHRKTGSSSFDMSTAETPFYASLLKKIIPFFHGAGEVVPPSEMIEVIRFLEAANESATNRKWVSI